MKVFGLGSEILMTQLNLQEEIEAAEDSREPPCQFALKWEGNQKRSYLQVLGPNETKTALKKTKGKGSPGQGLYG